MRADGRRVRGVHLLMVVAGAAVVAALQRRVEETVPVRLGADVAGGRAAVHAAVVPALLERAPGPRASALTAHVHDRRSDLTNHASLLCTRTLSPHPYPHFNCQSPDVRSRRPSY